MNRKKILKQLLLPGLAGATLVFVFVGIVGSALANPHPHEVPVAVVAPGPAVEQVKKGTEQMVPGALEIKGYDNAEAAKHDLNIQKVYGVIQPNKNTIAITVSTATGEAPKQLITQVFSGMAQATHRQTRVNDLTPQASGPGTALVMMFLLMISTAAAIVSQTLLRRDENKHFGLWFGGTVIAAVIIGLAGAATAAMLGQFQNAFWGITLALSTSTFVSSLIIAMFNALFGVKGLGLAALLLVPLGVATSSLMVNYHFLPDFYRAIASCMPSFATIDAIRQAAFLDNITIGTPYAIFGWWAFLSIVVIAITEVIRKRRSQAKK